MANQLGGMRERITILQRTATTDSQGGRAVAWSALDAVNAEYVPIRASERIQAMAIQAHVEHRFRVWTRSDIMPTMRLSWRPSWQSLTTPKTLEIHGVLPDPYDAATYLLLDCGEVVG